MRQNIELATRLNSMAAMQNNDASFTKYAAGAFAQYQYAAQSAAQSQDDIAAKLEAAMELMDNDGIAFELVTSALNDLRRFV